MKKEKTQWGGVAFNLVILAVINVYALMKPAEAVEKHHREYFYQEFTGSVIDWVFLMAANAVLLFLTAGFAGFWSSSEKPNSAAKTIGIYVVLALLLACIYWFN